MANSKQAAKRAKQASKQRTANMGLRTTLRTAIKKVAKALESKDKTGAQQAFREACAAIDHYAGKGLIHKNKAARHKSSLNNRVRALA